MRVTAAHAYRAQLDSMRRAAAESVKAQRIAASGSRVERPSDDAVAAGRAVLLRSASLDVAVARTKIGSAREELGSAEDALDGMGSLIARLRELAVQMASETAATSERESAAAEVGQMREAMIALGNARHGDRYVFGGLQTTATAFDAAGAYAGDSVQQSVTVAEGTSVAVTFAGDALLAGASGGPDILGSIQDFADALLASDLPGIQAATAAMDAAAEHVLDLRSAVGSSMSLLSSLDAHFEMAEVSLTSDLSEATEADALASYSELIRAQQAYQSAMQVSVASRTQSIFELL